MAPYEPVIELQRSAQHLLFCPPEPANGPNTIYLTKYQQFRSTIILAFLFVALISCSKWLKSDTNLRFSIIPFKGLQRGRSYDNGFKRLFAKNIKQFII
jgi:hypothetical protein